MKQAVTGHCLAGKGVDRLEFSVNSRFDWHHENHYYKFQPINMYKK